MTRPYNNDWKREATARLEAMAAEKPWIQQVEEDFPVVQRAEPVHYVLDKDCPPDTMYYVDPKSFVRIEASEALAEEEWGEEDKTFLVSPTGGRKEVKEARYSLIPTEALRALAEVYGRGAAKYEDHNWRRGYDFTASLDALQRHVEAFRSGQNIDPESGQPHIIHAAWHCFALHVFSTDDRYSRYDDRLPWEQR